MSMCKVFSCIVEKGSLLWPVYSLGKTLLVFSLLHFVLQGQTCLLTPDISWLPTFAFQISMMKRTSFLSVLESLVGVKRTIQLLQHYWLGHRLGLLWYWMVCLGNKQIILSFLRMHPRTAFWTLEEKLKAEGKRKDIPIWKQSSKE